MNRLYLALFFLILLTGLPVYGASECPGDFDCDGDVDGSDLATFAMDFGKTNCAPVNVITPCNCNEDSSKIQQAIYALPVAGGTIYLKAGNYALVSGIHIDRSNVTILGEQGTFLRLGEHVNQPVVLVGTDIESPTIIDIIKNIRVANFEIDGNRANQDSEVDPQRNWIRNNGIDIRAVENLWVENVNIHDARSGGIVASWISRRIFISNSSFHNNHFDGIALYDSEDIIISNFMTFENIGGAGISLDNNLKQVLFNNGFVKNNGDVGIFARDSEEINFHDVMISRNSSHGVFLSHKSIATNTGVKRLFFQGCSFLGNNGYGLWLASPTSESPSNTVIGCVFENNTLGCIKEDSGAYLLQASNICR
jgi:parallel beta-helix repeat protein